MQTNTALKPLLSKKEKKFIILWSNPSQDTLELNAVTDTNAYYLWTWNSFWQIIDAIFDIPVVHTLIKDMLQEIKNGNMLEVNALQQAIMNRINGCLWDIAKHATTDWSSLNKDLTVNEVNDLFEVFTEDEIKNLVVLVNGKGEKYTSLPILYKGKHLEKVIYLPCSSNVLSVSRKEKIKEWKKVFEDNWLI